MTAMKDTKADIALGIAPVADKSVSCATFHLAVTRAAAAPARHEINRTSRTGNDHPGIHWEDITR